MKLTFPEGSEPVRFWLRPGEGEGEGEGVGRGEEEEDEGETGRSPSRPREQGSRCRTLRLG